VSSLLGISQGFRRWRAAAIVVALLLVASRLAYHPSTLYLTAPIAGAGAVLLLLRPWLGLPLLVVAAIVVPIRFYTGTEVTLNPATLLIPALALLWLVDGVLHRRLALTLSRANRPLGLFLLAGLMSLLIGNALWDPAVPRSPNLVLVQLSQWAIFVLAAAAFWLSAALLRDERRVGVLTVSLLVLAGLLAIVRVLPGGLGLIGRYTTGAVDRAPYWAVLAAVAGGQLLFNDKLTRGQRSALGAIALAIVAYAFFLERQTASNWLGVAAALATLLWLRIEKWRTLVLVLALVALVIAFPLVYQFAGGEDEWEESGGSRLTLIGRVLEVAMRNPITGIGPASYRAYANVKPLQYGRAFWVNPQINSHNNYVDLFAHVGLLGLGLFCWFAWELWRMGLRLVDRPISGFLRGYVSAGLATLVAALVLMAFADWILPFVYNIGFPGFQASLLVWVVLGGLVAVEQMQGAEAAHG
jgi:hypothetical protein